MKLNQRPIVSAVALALLGTTFQASAQVATQETITVTGIRASLEKSLETKRNADTVTEVITSEDIGKMPDRNITGAVQRVPAVTIISQSSGAGGSDSS